VVVLVLAVVCVSLTRDRVFCDRNSNYFTNDPEGIAECMRLCPSSAADDHHCRTLNQNGNTVLYAAIAVSGGLMMLVGIAALGLHKQSRFCLFSVVLLDIAAAIALELVLLGLVVAGVVATEFSESKFQIAGWLLALDSWITAIVVSAVAHTCKVITVSYSRD